MVEERTPPRKAKRERREPEVPHAPVALDERGKALSKLLPDALKGVKSEIGAMVDEIVVNVDAKDVLAICQIMREDSRLDFNYLRCISVVDYVEHLEVVYHLLSLEKRHKLVIKAHTPSDDPCVPSVTSLWRGADWFEREGHDLFGVVFEGHPNLIPLVLYEGFEGYPGRKSFPFHDYDEW